MKSVREGYKMTELGEIPEEWEVKSLEDIRDNNDRYSFAGGPFGSDLKSEHYTEEGVRVIQLQNIGNGYFNNNYKIYTSVDKADELLKCNIYPNDLIIAKMAEPVARACKIPNHEKRYLMCSDGIRLSIDKNYNNTDYIMYSINSGYFRKNAIANSTGSTRLRIGLNELKSLPILIPELKEQEKIASILSTVDEQIDNVDALIEKNKEFKKGLMQTLLTKGIGHTKFKKTEVGEIPEKWEIKSLGNIVEVISGATPKTNINEYWNNGYIYWATPSDITSNGKYISMTEKTITENGLKNCSAKLLPIGSILMSSRATIGERCINTVPMATNQGFKSLVCKEGINNEFIYYYVDILKEKLIGLASGSTFLEVSKKVVEDIKVVVPSLKEQEKIASILSEVDKIIDDYENKKQRLDEVKKGLMQQLLTGKIRTV